MVWWVAGPNRRRNCFALFCVVCIFSFLLCRTKALRSCDFSPLLVLYDISIYN
jgi:hypothetical protein